MTMVHKNIWERFANSLDDVCFCDNPQGLYPSKCKGKNPINTIALQPFKIEIVDPNLSRTVSAIYIAAEESFKISEARTPSICVTKSNVEVAFVKKVKSTSKVVMSFHADFEVNSNLMPMPRHPVFHLQVSPRLNQLEVLFDKENIETDCFDIKDFRIPTAQLSFCQILIVLASYLLNETEFKQFSTEVASVVKISANCPAHIKRITEEAPQDPFCLSHWYPID